MRTIFTLLLAALLALAASLPAQALTVGFAPSTKTVGVGASFGIDVVVARTANEIVAAYDLDVAYDPSIITATSVAFGPYLGGPVDSISGYNLFTGLIDFAEVSFLTDGDLLRLQPATFTLATLYFTADDEGTTALTLANYLDGFNDIKGLRNEPYGGQILPYPDLDEGQVTVTGGVVPEPSTFILLGVGLAGLLACRRKLRG